MSIRAANAALAVSAAKWPPAAALAGLLVVGAFLPERYGLMPDWATIPLSILVFLLVAASTFAHASKTLRRIEQLTTASLLVVVTAVMVFALGRVVTLVFAESSALRGLTLMSTALTLWMTNLVVFSLWYWLVDRGGPERRLQRAPGRADIFFPQLPGEPVLLPGYIDYVFVAFTTSVAFSPCDAIPLTHRAKILMMTQATLSLVTVVVLVARAVSLFD